MKIIIKINILILIFLVIVSCTNRHHIIYPSKQFNEDEYDQIMQVVKTVSDTVSIENAKYDFNDYIDSWPDSMSRFKEFVLNIRKDSDLPIGIDSAYIRGLNDAKNDIEQRHFKVLGYGLDVIVQVDNGPKYYKDEVYKYILSRDYGIHYEIFAGCLVDAPIKAYIEAYNRLAKTVFRTFYKEDIFINANDKISDTILKDGENIKNNW